MEVCSIILGLLCVTCTDLAVLAGSYPEACYSKYQSVPIKGDACHEGALRIVLSFIDQVASRHKKYIKPLLSVQVDFYLRVFIQVFSKASESKLCATKQSYMFRCHNCFSFTESPVLNHIVKGNSQKFQTNFLLPENVDCSCCTGKMHLHGPLWNKSMHENSFIASVIDFCKKEDVKLGTKDRIIGVLSVAKEVFFIILGN